ncbi:mismatch repair-related protein [Mucor ambiguus]|uniref:Mismatch repair-related protein n=1 Tax=Mucor ambiguus TaxID=91626 RepID=A0A0C9MFZ4_9FUNG|nr:mismatch repair-related protein [Mucor ambiguus]
MLSDKIQLLDTSVIRQLRSSLVITTITQCLKELIENALDAKAANIDIFLDIEKFSLQVNDDGVGIQNLNRIGQRHVTSKCHTLPDIKQLKTYGYRGEALAAIVNESLTQIITRHYLSSDTFEGFWRDGKMVGEVCVSKHTRKNRSGTNVVVRDLFYKFPVRRKKITASSSSYQQVVIFESVKRLVTTFAILFPHVSFNLVDNARGIKLLTLKATSSTIQTFKQILNQDITKHIETLSMQMNDLKTKAYFSPTSYPNKSHQYIYLNKHLVPTSSDLYRCVSDLFSASQFLVAKEQERITAFSRSGKGRFIQKYPIYIIKCICDTWSSYDISIYLEMLNEFYDYQNIKTMITRITNQFLGQAGLAREKFNVEPKTKRLKVDKTSKEIVDPYVAHSVVSSHSHTNAIVQQEQSQQQQQQQQQQPEYLTWWDPNKQIMFYIDPITGNSFLSPSQLPKSAPAPPPLPPPSSGISCQSSSSRHSNIDRSHLKTTSTRSKVALDLPFKNDTPWPLRSPFLETSYKLSKQDLQNVTILDQVDKKFIALQLNSPNKVLIMIDQHAADERIKLEEMISTGIQSTTILEPSIAIDIDSSTEYQTLKNDDRILKCLKKWGIRIQFGQNNATTATRVTTLSQSRYFDTSEESPHFQKSKMFVTHIPQLITERCMANHSLLKSIILDHMYWVVEQTDEFAIANTCPRGILEILKSKACRSAIMFNDELTIEQCSRIVKRLSMCTFPFQCAHGRPSAIPIHLDTSSSRHSSQRPTNWSRFKI